MESKWIVPAPYLSAISLPTTNYSSFFSSGVRHYCCVNFPRAIQTVCAWIKLWFAYLFTLRCIVCPCWIRYIYYSISSTVVEIMLSLATCVSVAHERDDAMEFTSKGESIPIMVICWMEWLIFIIEELREEEEKTWNCWCEGCRFILLTQTHRNWNKIQWTPSCRYKNESVQLLFFLAFYYFHLNLNQQQGTQRLISFFFCRALILNAIAIGVSIEPTKCSAYKFSLLIPSIQSIIIIFLLAFLSVERIDFEIDSGQSRINFTINRIKTRGISVRCLPNRKLNLLMFFLPSNDAATHSIWLCLMVTGYWVSGSGLKRTRTYFIIQDAFTLDYYKFA